MAVYYIPRGKGETGLAALRNQGSPLRFDPFGTIALDFFHPLIVSQLPGFPGKPGSLFWENSGGFTPSSMTTSRTHRAMVRYT
jgi:hypothetical protein